MATTYLIISLETITGNRQFLNLQVILKMPQITSWEYLFILINLHYCHKVHSVHCSRIRNWILSSFDWCSVSTKFQHPPSSCDILRQSLIKTKLFVSPYSVFFSNCHLFFLGNISLDNIINLCYFLLSSCLCSHKMKES